MVVLAQVLGSVDGCACGYPHEDVHARTRISTLKYVVYGDAAIRAHAPRARLCGSTTSTVERRAVFWGGDRLLGP